jgi:hypothetical protein
MKPKLVKGKQKLPRPLRVEQVGLGRLETSNDEVNIMIPAGIYLPAYPGNPVTGVSFFADIRIPFFDKNEKLEEGITREDVIDGAKYEAAEWLNDFDRGVRGFKKWRV